VDVQDLGYSDNVAEFCSVKSDVPVEEYAQHHIEALKDFFYKC
jgi:hypothetical protein